MKTGLIGLIVLCSFVLIATADYLPIGTIQGAGHQSKYTGSVVTTDGVVTRVFRDGFIIQSKTPNALQETSEAIYIYQKETKIAVGNEIRVTGIVEEYIPGGNDSHNLSLTQIKGDTVKFISRNSKLPKPVVLNYLLTEFPKVIKRPGSPFDPRMNAMDFYESLEHMRVVVLEPTIVGPKTQYREIAVAVPQAKPQPTTQRGGVILTGYGFNPPKLLVSLGRENSHNYNTGDRLRDPIHGTLSYSFGNYKVDSSKPIPPPNPNWIPKITESPDVPDKALSFASFNVENLYLDLPDEKFETLAKIIVTSLDSPDILALQEIHDNSGPENDGVVDATKVLEKLIRFISKTGGPNYRFHQLNPENNADGGWPGANIRNAYLYQENAAKLVRSYRLQDGVFNINDETDFSGTRKPLVAFFKTEKETLIFINCHLRSKGGDSPPYGSLMPAVRFSENQRIPQTLALRKHVNELHKKYPEAGIVVLGDMNDFEFSPAIQKLTEGRQGLINLIETIPPTERYTYIYQGFSQVLDHILVSRNLASRAKAHIAHINADLSESTRSSDHDPVLVWLKVP